MGLHRRARLLKPVPATRSGLPPGAFATRRSGIRSPAVHQRAARAGVFALRTGLRDRRVLAHAAVPFSPLSSFPSRVSPRLPTSSGALRTSVPRAAHRVAPEHVVHPPAPGTRSPSTAPDCAKWDQLSARHTSDRESYHCLRLPPQWPAWRRTPLLTAIPTASPVGSGPEGRTHNTNTCIRNRCSPRP